MSQIKENNECYNNKRDNKKIEKSKMKISSPLENSLQDIKRNMQVIKILIKEIIIKKIILN